MFISIMCIYIQYISIGRGLYIRGHNTCGFRRWDAKSRVMLWYTPVIKRWHWSDSIIKKEMSVLRDQLPSSKRRKVKVSVCRWMFNRVNGCRCCIRTCWGFDEASWWTVRKEEPWQCLSHLYRVCSVLVLLRFILAIKMKFWSCGGETAAWKGISHTSLDERAFLIWCFRHLMLVNLVNIKGLLKVNLTWRNSFLHASLCPVYFCPKLQQFL